MRSSNGPDTFNRYRWTCNDVQKQSFCRSPRKPQGPPALPFCHLVLKAHKPPSSEFPKELRTLGDHIRKRRLDLGLFQKHVADQIGVDEDTIYRWESNESRPQVQFIPAIIKFLSHNPIPLPDSPSQRLVFYRRVHGVSQRALAKKIGLDAKAIELAETGKRPLSKKLLKLLETLEAW
jgi:transcriptional regulator with XRE-family HTH domain